MGFGQSARAPTRQDHGQERGTLVSNSHVPMTELGTPAAAAKAFARADLACHFGPSFFLRYLGSFVRDHCPDPGEHLPVVELRLVSGEILKLCHVVGVSPRWVMLAIPAVESHGDGMAIELLPYETICSVCIRTRDTGSGSIGFNQVRAPEIIAPEALLQAAMAHDRATGA